MYPRGIWSYCGIDPRITPAEIAKHVGLRRKAVWARIRQWKRAGIWKDPRVFPNPQLFGLREFQVEMPVADPSEGSAVMDKLERVGGIIDSMIAFSDTEAGPSADIVQLVFVAESGREFQRIARLLKRISPTGSLFGPAQDILPRCTQDLSPIDWRILSALVENPGGSLSQIARLARVTLKTAARRRSALIDSQAVWFIPDIDWSRHPSIVFNLTCHEAGDMPRVRAALDERFPHSLPMATEYFGSIYDPPRPVVMIRVPAHSPGERQKLELELSRLPGVKLVRPSIWGPSRWYPYWATGVIAARSPPKGTQPSVAERRALPPKRPS